MDANKIMNRVDGIGIPTDEQNRILKRALRLLIYHADTYGPVNSKTIAQFVDNCADYRLSAEKPIYNPQLTGNH